jgi:hypothetical protein
LRGRRDLLQARAHCGARAFEFFGFVRDAFAGLGDLDFGAFERNCATDGEAATGDDATQTVGLALLLDGRCNGRSSLRRTPVFPSRDRINFLISEIAFAASSPDATSVNSSPPCAPSDISATALFAFALRPRAEIVISAAADLAEFAISAAGRA